MALDFWNSALKTDVWFTLGKDSNGNKRYQQANFYRMLWAPSETGAKEIYFVPKGIDTPVASMINTSGKAVHLPITEFGYWSGDIEYVPYSGSEGWQEVQSFGFI